MVFPAELRAQSGSLTTQYMVHKDVYTNSLEIFTLEEWAKHSEAVRQKMNPLSHKGSIAWEMFNRHRAIVVPDEKNGRILIPKYLLEMIGVQKEVVFMGLDYKIKLCARENAGNGMSEAEFSELYDQLMQ